VKFLKKLFGGEEPLSAMRRAVDQRRWADALSHAEQVDADGLAGSERESYETMLTTAGDTLAELNREEAEAFLRGGDPQRALEHFQLAAAQARSPEAVARALARLHDLSQTGAELSDTAPVKAAISCSGTCSGHSATPADADVDGLDPQCRLDLILAGYPGDLAARYQAKVGAFIAAFLLAHDGHDTEALAMFDSMPDASRDDLWFFERGSLLGRIDRIGEGIAELERALSINPGLHPALEALIQMEFASGREASLRKRLEQRLTLGQAPAFVHGWLAVLMAREGQLESALGHARQAIARGGRDPEILQLAGTLLERNGLIDEAEQMLLRLPSGGCSGGPSLPLAEFWLRHNRNLDKALLWFKAGLRSEPDNPRWLLRIGQVYLGRGWQREGIRMIRQALENQALEPALRDEAREALDRG
jgi:tetratricopeptide (TPR) repeat protein